MSGVELQAGEPGARLGAARRQAGLHIAALAWFDDIHGGQRIACMIEDGHKASDALARRLGFVPYARHEPEAGAALILYQRMPQA